MKTALLNNIAVFSKDNTFFCRFYKNVIIVAGHEMALNFTHRYRTAKNCIAPARLIPQAFKLLIKYLLSLKIADLYGFES